MVQKKNKGFTLLEVLITTMIMVSVLGALVYGLSQCSNVGNAVHNQDIALNAAQQQLEVIANNLDKIESYDGDTFDVDELPDFSTTTSVWVPPSKGCRGTNPGYWDPTTTVTPNGAVDVTPVIPNKLYDVTVTMTWEQRGQAISRSLSTTFHI